MDNDRDITSTLVARTFLDIATKKDNNVTHLQLHKLVFFAHGWSFPILQRPLVAEDPVAWQHGPVFRNLFYALKRFRKDEVVTKVPMCVAERLAGWKGKNYLDDNEQEFIDIVYMRYSKLEPRDLVDLTHQEDTPWYDTEEGNVIAQYKIIEYFHEQDELRRSGKKFI